MAELYRVEKYHDASAFVRYEEPVSIGRVVCSFISDTRREGTMVKCKDGKISTLDGQPDLNLYPKEEQEYMKQATAIAYMLIFSGEHGRKEEYHKA